MTTHIPPIGTRVRVVGGSSVSPTGTGTVVGTGHVLVEPTPIYDGPNLPARFEGVAIVQLDEHLWMDDEHIAVTHITVHPDNLDLEV